MTVRVLAAALIVATSVAASGCFLRPKKKDGKKSEGHASGLMDRGSVFMDRIGGGDDASLRFKTTRPALCELQHFSQQPGIEPTKDAPKVTPCSVQDRGRQEFTEQIGGLRTDALYYVIIKVWEPGGSKDKAETVTVQETRTTDSSTNGPVDDKLSSLWVGRFDVPLRTAEVHKHDLPQPTDVSTIRQVLTMGTGCREGVPEQKAPYRDAAKDSQLVGLTSQDFAAATAVPHPDAEGRLQLRFASLNDGVDKWTLLFKLLGKDFRIPVRPISRILNMEMESAEIVAFDEPQLEEAVDPLKIDVTKPLKLKWTTGANLLDLSYMTFQIGRPDDPKAVYCVFPAGARAATIEPKWLAGLEDGKYVVLAELVSHQIWLKYGWLVTVYDWRSGRIEK